MNSCGDVGYYVELIGIRGLNGLSKHFINREWISERERFIGALYGYMQTEAEQQGSVPALQAGECDAT